MARRRQRRLDYSCVTAGDKAGPRYSVPTMTPPGARSAFATFSDPSASPWKAPLTGTSFDGTAPTVKIKSVKVNKKKRKATAKFSAKDDVSPKSKLAFKCSLDGKRARKCSSPKTYNKLKPGKHTFAVTARDQAGNKSKAVKKKFKISRAPTTRSG